MPAPLRVAIFGATGFVGAGVLRACIDDPDVTAIHVVTRRPIDLEDARLTTHLCEDFSALGEAAAALDGVDAVFYCLGISASKVDGEAAYRVITYDYAMEAGRQLQARSPEATLHFISGAMTRPDSRMMWARVKGETEVALGKLGLGGLVCWRPAVVHDGRGFGRLLGGWRSAVHRRAVGEAMLQVTREGRGEGIIENPEIRDHADRYAGRPPAKRRRIWRRVLGGLALLLVLFLVVVLVDGWSAFGKAPEGARQARMQRSPEWDAEREVFENTEPLWNDWWRMVTEAADASEHGSPEAPPPVVTVDPARFATPPPSGLRVTWLGHSTLLIEMEGHVFLTDPLWGERTSPLTWLGPERWYPPPLALDNLPALDAVIISHDHYDHLDYPTIVRLAGHDTTFIAPLGVGAHLAYWGVAEERIVELDWWQSHTIGEVEVAATPARHASGRFVGGENRTLWAGYAFLGKQHRAFFSGDTGLFPGMADIGERYGPFDVTMIEVGAYGQAWPDWHLGPEQAVRAHRMLRGEVMLPVHWGLFNLAYHGWTEPIERVLVAAAAREVTVVTPLPGASFEPSAPPPVARWWPELPWRSAEAYPIVATRVPPE